VSFVEIDVFGVLISPLVPLMVLAAAITVALRVIMTELGLTRHIWHPALFEFSMFLILLTAAVLILGGLKIYA
jgi:protein AaeX